MSKPMFVFTNKPSVNTPKAPATSANVNVSDEYDDDFTRPSKRKTVSSVNTQPKKYVLDISQLYNQNKYKPLSDHTYAQSASHEMDDESNLTESPKIVKPPPIFVHDVNNHQEIVKDIKSLISNEFSTEVKGTTLKINLSTIDDFRKLTKFYDDSNVKYHTFQTKIDKKLEVVVKNVPTSLTPDEIKAELIEKNYPVLVVARLFNKDKVPFPICAVTLENTESGKDIFHLDRLCYSVVHVEPKKKSVNVPQCTRCQRYGHTRNFCKLDPRCVRCTGQHLFSACPKNKTDPPVCVNCGENHTANFKGCKYYQDLKSKSKNNNNNPAPLRRPSISFVSEPILSETSEAGSSQPPSSSLKTYSQAARTTTAKPQTRLPRSTPSVSPTETNEDETSEVNDCIPNLEKLVLDLVKSVMPIIRKIISNVVSSFLRNESN